MLNNQLTCTMDARTEALPWNVQAYTSGYDRDLDLIPRLASAIRAHVTGYGLVEAVTSHLRN